MVSNIAKWPLYVDLTRNLANATIDSTSSFVKPLIYITGAWLTAISFSIVEGIGGFLSGLFQVRESETNLRIHEVSVLLFQLRHIFGAFAALVSFMLLSWGVFDDVIANNPGSYALIAFVSGFSERYFIKLLKLNIDEKTLDAKDIDAADNPSRESDSQSNKG